MKTKQEHEIKAGDLIWIVRNGTNILCRTNVGDDPKVIECPAEEYEAYIRINNSSRHAGRENIFENLEGKVGLVVYVSKNRLQQSLGYRILIEGHEMFFKSIVADKYFRLAENQKNETGGSS